MKRVEAISTKAKTAATKFEFENFIVSFNLKLQKAQYSSRVFNVAFKASIRRHGFGRGSMLHCIIGRNI